MNFGVTEKHTENRFTRVHGSAVDIAVTSQLEAPGFVSRQGTLWALAACSLLCIIRAHTLGGVGKRAFLCGVCMFSLCPL